VSSRRSASPSLSLRSAFGSSLALPLASALARALDGREVFRPRVSRLGVPRARAEVETHRRVRATEQWRFEHDARLDAGVDRTARLERTRGRPARDETRRDASDRACERKGEMKAS